MIMKLNWKFQEGGVEVAGSNQRTIFGGGGRYGYLFGTTQCDI